MVDFYTGAVLINSLVYPNVRMAHYNARFSGVTKQDMEEARRRNKCILGRDAARKAVYKYVGPNTVVIGHAGHQDLTSLRWTHRRIVDTLILETRKRLLDEDNAQRKEWEDVERREKAEPAAPSCNVGDEGDNAAANPQRGGLSLKALTLEKLNRVIQVKGRGHDSLEDALATRDLLHWHISAVLESSPPEGSS
jgi:RNA exonuclease 1